MSASFNAKAHLIEIVETVGFSYSYDRNIAEEILFSEGSYVEYDSDGRWLVIGDYGDNTLVHVHILMREDQQPKVLRIEREEKSEISVEVILQELPRLTRSDKLRVMQVLLVAISEDLKIAS